MRRTEKIFHIQFFVLLIVIAPLFSFAETGKCISPINSDTKVLLLVSGKVNDKSFSQAAYDGLKALKNHGYSVSYIQNTSKLKEKQLSVDLTRYIKKGFNAVIAAGNEFSPFITREARNYPHTRFAVISGHAQGRNVINYCLDCTPIGGYMAGAIASSLSKSHHIGFVGGVKTVDGNEAVAFRKSAVSLAPKTQVSINWINSWYNIDAAERMTDKMIKNGADVIVADANTGSVTAASRHKGVYVIGWMADQSSKQQNNVVATSIVIKMNVLFNMFINLLHKNSFNPGTRIIGPRDKVWALSPFSKKISPQLKEKINILIKRLKCKGKVCNF